MDEFHSEPLLSNEDDLRQAQKRSKVRKYLILAACVAVGLLAGVLIGYLSFGRKNTSTSNENVLAPQSLTSRDKKISFSDDCSNLEQFKCQGSSGDMPSKWANHTWATPDRGDSEWKPGYQDMSKLVGYARQVYSAGRTSCTVTVITRTRNNLDLTYHFDGQQQRSPSKVFDSSYKGLLKIKVTASSGETLELDDVDFIWNVEPLKQRNGDYRNGQKGAIVEMFGWPDEDIEQECKFIAEAGYLGVKLFPHQEQVMSLQPESSTNELNPWYYMYQPVSYRLQGRMGTRDQLRKMIKTCRSYGVRVYADAVVNHMTGNGNDVNEHRNNFGSCNYWPGKVSSDESKQSPFYTPGWSFGTNSRGEPRNVLEFPAVPYGPMDFHCEKILNNWSDGNILSTGWLTGLTDLDTSKDYVRQRIADYFTDLLSIGFTGFRVDAAKHIHPTDLAAIFKKFKDNLGGSFPDDWFTWLEVLTGGESYILLGGADQDYSFATGFENKLKAVGMSNDDILKIKIWWSGYPIEPYNDNNRVDIRRKVIQVDDHDQQNPGSSSRDMHDKGCVLAKGCPADRHRAYEIELFQNPNGAQNNDNDYPIRMVLSSYYFVNGNSGAIPDGKSDCSKCTISCNNCRTREYIKAYDPNGQAYSGSGYTRVHRDQAIINAMKQWMHI